MKKVILFLVGIVFFLYGCTQSNINVIQKVESPNGKYVAYAHVRNGGATTSFTPSVYIIESSYSENEQIEKLKRDKWNVFFAKNSNDNDINLEWENDSKLKITYHKGTSSIYYKVDIFNGIEIEYIEQD